MNGFAGGAILAAAFYLLLFEATHLISPYSQVTPAPQKRAAPCSCGVTRLAACPLSQYPQEAEGTTAAMWGSMILIGFISASILDLGVLT